MKKISQFHRFYKKYINKYINKLLLINDMELTC